MIGPSAACSYFYIVFVLFIINNLISYTTLPASYTTYLSTMVEEDVPTSEKGKKIEDQSHLICIRPLIRPENDDLWMLPAITRSNTMLWYVRLNDPIHQALVTAEFNLFIGNAPEGTYLTLDIEP